MATKKTTAAKTTNKKPASAARKVPHLYRERHTENHQIKGKFIGLYILFSITTLIFAAMSVWLFIFSTQILNKYDAIETCVRNRTCRIQDSNDNKDSDEDSNKE
jgi:hypothetical protein